MHTCTVMKLPDDGCPFHVYLAAFIPNYRPKVQRYPMQYVRLREYCSISITYIACNVIPQSDTCQ